MHGVAPRALFFLASAIGVASPAFAQSFAPQLAKPILKFAGTETYSAGDKFWVRNRFDVVNKSAFPNSLFAASPNLPPCGTNVNSSRTWVDFYDSKGKRLYGFCALESSDKLGTIWFATEICTVPPRQVYIEMHDRLRGVKVKSNLAAVKTLAEARAEASQAPKAGDGARGVPGPFMVFFDFGHAELTPSAAAILENVARIYSFSDAPYVSIVGHTDSAGSEAANRRLAQRRVAAVQKYLGGPCGIPANKIFTKIMGEKAGLVETTDESREPQNRRVEITFGAKPAPESGPGAWPGGARGGAAAVQPKWDEAGFQRKLAAHEAELERHRQAVAEYERQKSATEARKAQLRAQAEATRADWERRVAACRAGNFAQCSK